MNQPEPQEIDSPKLPATFAVPATILAVFGGLLFLLSAALLAVAVSFLSRGPSDRSGVLPALGIALILGCGAWFLLVASFRKRRNTFEGKPNTPRPTARQLFWFRFILFPIFVATTIGTLTNGFTCARLINQEFLQWIDLEPVKNWSAEQTPLAHMAETGIATIVLLPISLLLYFALFAKPRRQDHPGMMTSAHENDDDENPYSPPKQSDFRSIQPLQPADRNFSGKSTFHPLNAQLLHTREDMAFSLREEHVIVFVSVEWSGPERKSRVTFAEFMDRISSVGPDISFWILSERSDCIQDWFKHLNVPPTIATGFGAVIWIAFGHAVSVAEHAAEVGVEGLVNRTLELWGPGKATNMIPPHA